MATAVLQTRVDVDTKKGGRGTFESLDWIQQQQYGYS